MTAIEFMNRAYRIDLRIRLKKEQLEEIRSLASHITAAYGTEQVSHTRSTTTMDDNVIRIIEHEKALEQRIAELCAVRDETRSVIDLVADRDCRVLLESRYLNAKTWKAISEECGISIRQTIRKNKLALRMVETVLRTREAGKHA